MCTRIAALTAVLVSGACAAPREWKAERRAPLGATPASLEGPVAVKVLVFGDFGDLTRQQALVARAIIAENSAAPFDLAIHMGDNLYGCGPDPRVRNGKTCAFEADGNTVRPRPDIGADRRFARQFEDRLAPLASRGVAVPVYLAIGNHDVRADGQCHELRGDRAAEQRVKACLEVQHEGPHWTMPGRHYVVDRGPARFVVIDTVLLAGDYGGFRWEDELEFVRRSSDGCGAERHCFLVGHYYADVAGDARHRAAMVRSPVYAARVRQLEDAMGGRFSAWLAGHAHDLQHLRTAAGYDQFIVGATSSTRSTRFAGPFAGGRTVYWSERWGFGVLEVHAGGWAVELVGRDRRRLHCCRAIGQGPCEPYPCPSAFAAGGHVATSGTPRTARE
jgi:calcineurin-like phosphoesterase family protein